MKGGDVGNGLKICWKEMARLRLLRRIESHVVATLAGSLDGKFYCDL